MLMPFALLIGFPLFNEDGKPILLWLALVLLCGLVLALLLPFIFPRITEVRIQATESRLSVKTPWHREHSFAWSEISAVYGIARGDGGNGDNVDIRLHIPAGRINIAEKFFYESKLVDAFRSWDRIDQTAYQAAIAYEPKWSEMMLGKAFNMLKPTNDLVQQGAAVDATAPRPHH